jgi:hypothetical protein
MDFCMEEDMFHSIFMVKDMGPTQAFFEDYLDGHVDYEKHLENTGTPNLIPGNESKSEKLKRMLNIILGQLSTHAEERISEFALWGDNYCHIVCLQTPNPLNYEFIFLCGDTEFEVIRGETLTIESAANSEYSKSEDEDPLHRKREKPNRNKDRGMIPPIGILKQFSFSFAEFLSTFGIPYRMLCASEKIFFLNYIGLHFSSRINEDEKSEKDENDSNHSDNSGDQNASLSKILGINGETSNDHSKNSSQIKTVQDFKDYYYRRIFPGNEYKTPFTFS